MCGEVGGVNSIFREVFFLLPKITKERIKVEGGREKSERRGRGRGWRWEEGGGARREKKKISQEKSWAVFLFRRVHVRMCRCV